MLRRAAWLIPTLALPVVGVCQGVPWDLAAPVSPTTAVYLNSADGGQLGVPVQAADFNGDGLLDSAAAAFTSSTRARFRNGLVWVVMGGGSIGNTIDVATYTGPRLMIHGAVQDSLLGVEMASADLDKDGFADLILGSSHGAFFSEAARAGEVVVLFGSEEWGSTVRDLDISRLPGSQRARFILGESQRLSSGALVSGDRLGSWLGVHDLDANGLPDLVMGMDQSWGEQGNRDRAGACVILWDAPSALAGETRLRVGESASAESFTVIYGRDAGDMLGATHAAADLDDDGGLELVVAAGVTRSGLSISSLGYSGTGGGDGPANNQANMGEAYIFWGAAALRESRRIDLAALDSSRYTLLYGNSNSDYFGEELVVGDVTGDGVADLVVGALGYDVGANTLAGATFLYPGGAGLRGLSSHSVASPAPGYAVSGFLGTEFFGISGDTVELMDLNGDGVQELMIGVPYGTPEGRYQAGYVSVVFGGQDFPALPATIPTGLTVGGGLMYGLVFGADSLNGRGDYLAYSSAIGDFDGDGTMDFLPNAMQGDGFQNAYANAGEFYILSGRRLAQHAAAPTGARRVDEGGALARWEPAQPVFGAISGYRVRYEAGGNEGTQVVVGTSIYSTDLPPGARPLGITTVMENGESIEVLLPPFLGNRWQLE